ncbi:Mitogen-activated protein kinase kinase kinase kinase 1, partial [Camelus dromedarius]
TPHLYSHSILGLLERKEARAGSPIAHISPHRLLARKNMVSTKFRDTKGCRACCEGERESRGYAEGSGARGMTWTLATEEGCDLRQGVQSPGKDVWPLGARGRGDRIDPNPSFPTSTAEGASSGGPFLCGALETSVVLLQWQQPMNKFLLLRVGGL